MDAIGGAEVADGTNTAGSTADALMSDDSYVLASNQRTRQNLAWDYESSSRVCQPFCRLRNGIWQSLVSPTQA